MAFWGVEIKPGKPHVHQFDDEKGRLHVSQATLGTTKSKEKAVVVCNVGDKKPVYLCSLLPRKMETCTLHVEFEEYEEVTFSVEGPHSIHLSGFFFGQDPESDRGYDESDSEDGSYEGAEIESGDSEDGSFDFVDEDDISENEIDMLTIPNSGVRIEEIVDDEEADEKPKSEKSKKNKDGEDSQKQIVLKSSDSVPVLESEDEDGFPMTANEKAKRKKEVNDSDKSAKRKRDDSAIIDSPASEPAKVEAPTREAEVKKSKKKKNKKAKDTPEGGNKDSEKAPKEQKNQEQTPDKVTAKKNKQQEKSPGSKANASAGEAKPSQVRTFPNGLIIEEIQMGKPNGKRADAGKKISMRYIGKLKKNGKIFDSNIGKAPFKFRLGVGEVISGWDVGVKGMRVGDKRRLTIPPAMGYGSKGAGRDIPPNSWLMFDVELIDVN